MEVEISRIGIVESFLKIEETQDGSLRNVLFKIILRCELNLYIL